MDVYSIKITIKLKFFYERPILSLKKKFIPQNHYKQNTHPHKDIYQIYSIILKITLARSFKHLFLNLHANCI